MEQEVIPRGVDTGFGWTGSAVVDQVVEMPGDGVVEALQII